MTPKTPKRHPLELSSLPRETIQLMRRDVAAQIVSLLRRKALLNQEILSHASAAPRLREELARINRELEEAEALERRLSDMIQHHRKKSAG